MALIPFDDRDGFIWLDGQLVPWREATLHVLTHGLHYGSGVFEGERAYSGNIFRLRMHSERLIASGRLLGFEIPYTAEQIDEACKQVLAANNMTDAYLRPIAWRGSEMLSVSAQRTKIHLAIAAWVWPAYFENRMAGIALDWAEWRRPDPRTAPTSSKATGNYMIGTLSKHKAEAAGFADAMMLDWRGKLAEATGANVFLAIDGTLHTPEPVGFLDGITRRTVIALAHRRQIPVSVRTIEPEELDRAQEVFVTGSAAEVTPVRQIGDRHFTPGRLTEALVQDYEALVRMTPDDVANRLSIAD